MTTMSELDPTSPASNDSAGQGDDELRRIKEVFRGPNSSFPNWAAPDDVLQATATEIDDAIALGATAIQQFGPAANIRGGTGDPVTITPEDDDYTVDNIDDSAATFPTAQGDRNFMQDAEKTYLADLAAFTGTDPNDIDDILKEGAAIDVLGDVDTSTTPPNVGELLVWDGANWVPGVIGDLITAPTVEYWAAAETASISGWRRGTDGTPYWQVGDVLQETISAFGTIKNNNNDAKGWRFTASQKVDVCVTLMDLANQSSFADRTHEILVLEADLITLRTVAKKICNVPIGDYFAQPVTVTGYTSMEVGDQLYFTHTAPDTGTRNLSVSLSVRAAG